MRLPRGEKEAQLLAEFLEVNVAPGQREARGYGPPTPLGVIAAIHGARVLVIKNRLLDQAVAETEFSGPRLPVQRRGIEVEALALG